MGLKRNRKKGRRTHSEQEAPAAVTTKGPRILVINRGSVGPVIPHLMSDILKMLAPNAVRTIKVLRSSRVKDLMAASGPLHISHAIIFTRTVNGVYMKLCTFPHGPTITFSIQNYSLQRDVVGSQKRAPSVPPSYELTAPCLMMNSLQPHAGPRHLQLVAASMLQIFPKIVPNEASCRTIRRCCLLNYDEALQEFELRHYVVRLTNTASARLVAKLVNSKNIPDLHNFHKIEDALTGGAASESEGEEDSKVELSNQLEGSTRPHSAKSSIKLKDAGPRITMKVHKIESGLLGGEVLYNRVKKRSAKEILQLRELREIKKKEKLARKQRQLADIARKEKQAEEHRDKCLEGMTEEHRQRAIENKKKKEEEEVEEGDDELSEREDEVEEEKEDVDYYREEVGELPEGVSFSDRMKRRREKDTDALDNKKRKMEDVENNKLEAKRSKAKERYKKLDERKKKRPRAYGKRLVKQMKQKVKQRQAKKNSDKDKEEGGDQAGSKTSKSGPKAGKTGSKAGPSKK